MATYVLTIGGVAKTLQIQSLHIQETANRINTMQFDIASVDGSYRPAMGAEVILTEDGTRIFGGTIDMPAENGLISEAGGIQIVTKCTAVDFNELIDRRVLNLTIAAGTLKAALQALDDYLTDYGVTLDAGQVDGPALPELTFSYTSLRSAFDQLRELTDYVYEVDYTKTLRMFQPSATAAPFDITTANRKAIGDITVEPTRQDYANQVLVLGGQGQQEVTDTFTGDGVDDAFVLNYTMASHAGYVTVNAVAETLGETGSGATWTHATVSGTTTITRTSAVPDTHAISITYTAQFPKLVTATTSPSAADLVEKIYTYPEVFDVTVLQALADALVARTSTTRKTIRYRTIETGVHPGMTQTVTVAERGLSGTFLVTEVTVSNPFGNRVERTVTAVEGSVYLGSELDDVASWGGGSSVSSVGGSVTVVSGGSVGGAGTSGKLAQWTGAGLLGDGPTASAVVLTSGSYADPAWVTSLAASKLTGTIASAVQDNITRTGTLVAGATGAGFTVALTTSTVSGNLPYANLPSGVGTWSATPTISGVTTFTTHAVPLTNYASNLGELTAKYLAVHAAELLVETLVAQDVMATIGGRVVVASTTLLTAALGDGAGDTTITVKHNQIANGDRIRLEAGGQVEWMAVTSAAGGSAGAYTYSVTRDLDGTGRNAWLAGDAVLNTGTTGDGFIDLYSTSGVLSGTGPTIVGNVRTGTTYSNIAPRWAIGNMNGTSDYVTDIYGAFFGDASAANITIDATNGFRIRQGTTDYAVMASSTFRLGASGGNRVEWDGTDLSVVSENLIIDDVGIRIVPGTVGYDPASAFSFEAADGAIGVYGYSASGYFINVSAVSDDDTRAVNAFFGVGNEGTLGAQSGLSVSMAASATGSTITLGNSSDVISLGGKLTVAAGLTGSAAIATSLATFSATGNPHLLLSNSSPVGQSPLDFEINSTLRGRIRVDYTGQMNYVANGGAHNFWYGGDFGVGTLCQIITTSGDWTPGADNTQSVGTAGVRYSLIRGVTITPGDLAFENGWTFTESWKVGIAAEGIAVLDAAGELVGFFGRDGFRAKGLSGPLDVDDLPYVPTTGLERAEMDLTPEVRGKRPEDVRPKPDPTTGQSNRQRGR